MFLDPGKDTVSGKFSRKNEVDAPWTLCRFRETVKFSVQDAFPGKNASATQQAALCAVCELHIRFGSIGLVFV